MKTLLLSLLAIFTVFMLSILYTIVHKVHFGPVGVSLFVFAWLIITNSFPAFFLGVILDLVVEAELPIPFGVVPQPVPVAVLTGAGGLISAICSCSFLASIVLESWNLAAIIATGVALLMDGHNTLGSFAHLPFNVVGCLVVFIKGDFCQTLLGNHMVNISRQCCPEELHLEKLEGIVH